MNNENDIKSLNLSICNQLLGENRTNQIKAIFDNCNIKQRSEQWFKIRKITASKILDAVEEFSFAEFVLEQSATTKTFVNNEHVMHGKNMEYLSQLLYKHIFKTEVLEMSIVQHKSLDFIGATPDGFVIMNNPISNDFKSKERLLEIKCPTKRVINPCGKDIFAVCPYGYLAQMWTQMECCQLGVNDFWQTRITLHDNLTELNRDYDQDKRYSNQEFLNQYKKYYKPESGVQIRPTITYNRINNFDTFEQVNTQGMNFKGALLIMYGPKYPDDQFDIIYLYDTDLSHTFDQQWDYVMDLQEEYKDKQIKIEGIDYKAGEIKFWRLEHGHLAQVQSNAQWFNSRKNTMVKVWNMICFLRENPEYWNQLNEKRELYVNEFKDKFKNKIVVQQKFNQFNQDFSKLQLQFIYKRDKQILQEDQQQQMQQE